jgi:uncharacterized protein
MLINEIRSLAPEIEALARKHGAVRLRVFGSVARGEERTDSDVDFLVLMGEDRSLLDRITLKHALEDLLGRRVDLVSERAIAKGLRRQVLEEAQAL